MLVELFCLIGILSCLISSMASYVCLCVMDRHDKELEMIRDTQKYIVDNQDILKTIVGLQANRLVELENNNYEVVQ